MLQNAVHCVIVSFVNFTNVSNLLMYRMQPTHHSKRLARFEYRLLRPLLALFCPPHPKYVSTAVRAIYFRELAYPSWWIPRTCCSTKVTVRHNPHLLLVVHHYYAKWQKRSGPNGSDGANSRALPVTDYAVCGEDFVIRLERPYVSVRFKEARENGSQGGQKTGKTFGNSGRL